MAASKQTAVRFTPDDVRVIDAIRSKTGILSTTEVIRMAVRTLAASLDITIPEPKKSKK